MLKPAIDVARQLLALLKDVQRSKEDIKDLQLGLKDVRSEMRDIVLLVHELTHRVQRAEENQQHEHEKLILRLENAWLRHKQGLPPAPDSPSLSDAD